ncbi:Uncharacterised protein [Mesomycoplasma conjunctivae]|nr:Uncharacterised protein [Mesomycoplasma conjunctivae]
MLIKLLNKDVKIEINGSSKWAFANRMTYKKHLFNPTTITLHNLISKQRLQTNQHFTSYDKIDTFTNITLKSADDQVIFSGLIESQGRLSLMPNKFKDQSIIAYDNRWWLSHIEPPAIEWIKVDVREALNEYISLLNEPKIKLHKIDFKPGLKINAYNTTNKTPFSVLKSFFAPYTNTHVVFETNNAGELLISFLNPQEMKKNKTIINNENVKSLFITDLQIDKNSFQYANVLRTESTNVVGNLGQRDIYNLHPLENKIALSSPVANIERNSEQNFFWNWKTKKKNHLIIINKDEVKNTLKWHLAYELNSNLLQVNPEWKREEFNQVFISYSKYNRQAIQLENKKEINHIAKISGFSGRVFYWDKYNDITTTPELASRAEEQLTHSSGSTYDLVISTSKVNWDVGDFVELKINSIADGVYIILELEGSLDISSNNHNITYKLRNTSNGETALNFYDEQSYRDMPQKLNKEPYQTNSIIYGNIKVDTLVKRTKKNT